MGPQGQMSHGDKDTVYYLSSYLSYLSYYYLSSSNYSLIT